MRIGSRILYPEEVHQWDLDIAQVSVYKGFRGNLEIMKACALECKRNGLRYVIHPVGYSLINPKMFHDIISIAEWTGEALILHDERAVSGGRLMGKDEERFKDALDELTAITTVSFENANNTRDVLWFWQSHAESITVDIGHIEAAGLDSVEFVKDLDQDIINKITYVHVHRNSEFRNGLTDHWYLIEGCRELLALEELLKRKKDMGVILEVNETEMIEESLTILKDLRARITTEN